jgi:hypothetical protein
MEETGIKINNRNGFPTKPLVFKRSVTASQKLAGNK